MTVDASVESVRFSPCRRWRYALDLIVARDVLLGDLPSRGSLGVIMLNPSTADERRLDPTIRRVIGFARTWGFHRVRVRNLYAYRATDPAELRRCASELGLDPVSAHDDPWANDRAILELASPSVASTILVAWGSAMGAWMAPRVEHVRARMSGTLEVRSRQHADVICLGVTADGAPRHPLYVAARTAPVRWPLGM